MSEVRLNKNQQEAVDHTTGPMLVVAGAGTGKTSVITQRILRLIESGIKPESILALTFTEKAAGEMLDRVNELRGGFTLDTTIATFNGFGDEILREYGFEMGLGGLNLLGETGKLVFLRDNLDDLNLDYFAPVSRPDSQLENISGYISELKQQLISPADYIKFAESLKAIDEESKLEKTKHLELANAYQAYTELCRKHHQIDYDDQIYLTIELLKKRPNVRKQLQEKFQYILVDEYQDTNPMQSEIIDLIYSPNNEVRLRAGEVVSARSRESQANRTSGTEKRDSQDSALEIPAKPAGLAALPSSSPADARSLMVVGDDDQSIYGWRGATLANILQFNKQYQNTKEVTLIENYRSTQPILDSAYQLIQNNNPNRLESINNLDKRLRANVDGDALPVVLNFTSLDAELNFIAGDIAKRVADGQNPGTIAVLARRTATIQKVHDVFDLHSLDHAVAGLSNDIYDQTVVRQLIEAFKAVADPSDSQAFYHTLVGPVFGFDAHQTATWLSEAKKSHSNLQEILKSSDDQQIKSTLELINSWRSQMQNISVGQLAYKIISESGWLNTLVQSAKTEEDASVQVQALSQYFKLLKEFEKISGIASVHQYLDNLEVLRSAGSELHDPTLDISDTKINVLSVHRSKGLEWDTVYIVDCTEGSFPMRKFGGGLSVPEELKTTSDADGHMAEERRLMYVAITRARRELFLSHSDTHTGNTKRRPSRFLAELDGIVSTGKKVTGSDSTDVDNFAPKTNAKTVSLPASMRAGDKFILSVSEAEKWLRCPLDFYYRYVLQVPQPPNPTLIHGTIIHDCIEQINRGLLSDNIPALEDLLENAESLLPAEGYLSAKQRERAHKQIISSVKLVYERFVSEPAPERTEFPFKINVPDSKLMLKGRIDAVYNTANGVEIRDYKTGGSVQTPEKAKQRATGSQQLAIYALAWRELEGEIPSLLTLDFVETGQLGSVKKQAKTIDNLAEKLAKIPEDLEAGKFDPGTDHTYCIHPL